MKTIGLIGGTSWVSTVEYYKLINQFTNQALGGMSSARILLHSVNLAEFKAMADAGDWAQAANVFSGAAKGLEISGADCLLLCANTTHVIAGEVQASIKIPVIHIAEETAKEVKKKQIKKVGLLGTQFTMKSNFYFDKLSAYNIDAIVPDESEKEFIHASIFSELSKGIFTDQTKERYLEIIDHLETQGAEGIVLACTEIPMLISPADCRIPVFDTTFIHAKGAVHFSLS